MPNIKRVHAPTLHGSDLKEKRQEIKEYFNMTFDTYESLFGLLADESTYLYKPNSLRHPLIFYYGHTATFFINKLRLSEVISERLDANLESIFAVGVDEMSWDDLDAKHYSWPSVEETKNYRNRVRESINGLIDRLPLSLPITEDSAWWVILMGIEHENIHIETSSVLIRELPLSSVVSSDLWPLCKESGDAPTNLLLPIDEGKVSFGKNSMYDYYRWDNEYGDHEADIPSFSASKYLVSHGEFLPFVEEGGYLESRFWSQEGWEWRELVGASHPTFWILKHGRYSLRTLTEEIALPLNWPAEVNYHEAMAFCSWLSQKSGASITLPTEDEYMRLYDFCEVSLLADQEEQTIANTNLEVVASSVPVDRFAHGKLYDVVGNVWQWSRTPIYPFEGFDVHPMYDDFSVPTFDGNHNLIKGGSWASCGNLSSSESRYAFRKHFFQHAGFRYIESTYREQIEDEGYESDALISQYCHFGWGEDYFGVENYPAKCASLAIDAMGEKPKRRALDLGCAIGRSSFELARGFEEVVGIDFSARFIQNAQMLKERGSLRYAIPTEGSLEELHKIELAEYGVDGLRDRVEFWQGDACNLKPIYTGFDLIFGGNLLDRLYDPYRFLRSLESRLNSHGLLILTSPYTWQEESTPRDRWVGGFKRGGESFTTLHGLQEILGEAFRLKETLDIPFVIRETARKYQHTIAQMSIWEKRS